MNEPIRLSANTGFLFPDRPFLERIVAAGRAGFDMVEFHDEWRDVSRDDLRAALREAGRNGTPMPVAGLNARMGEQAGAAAVPGDEAQAREDIAEAVDAAVALGAGATHVLAGKVEATEDAMAAYRANLAHACDLAARMGDGGGPTILIEPLCTAAMPVYPLRTVDAAVKVIRDVAAMREVSGGTGPGPRVMLDLFHVHGEGDDPVALVRRHADLIGHVQIADPDTRAEPSDGGTHAVGPALLALREAGYGGAFGAEYRPRGRTEGGLGWMDAARAVA